MIYKLFARKTSCGAAMLANRSALKYFKQRIG